MSRSRLVLVAAAALVPLAAAGQEDDSPGLALLEYLGSWDDSDEDWLVVAEEMPGSRANEDEEAPAAVGQSDDATNGDDDEAEQNDED
jgi:hypothetical protein